MNQHSGVRLDRWLWAARFYKTRQLATNAIKSRRITVNHQSPKPAKRIVAGDQLTIRKGSLTYVIEVLALAEKRLGPVAAQALYQENTAALERRLLIQYELREQHTSRAPNIRPDKKQRRQLMQLKKG